MFTNVDTILDGMKPSPSAQLNALRAGRPALIYGAGRTGRDVYDVVTAEGVKVHGFLDRRGGDGLLWPAPVHVFGQEPFSPSERKDMTVIVAVFNRDADPAAIDNDLSRSGYGDRLDFVTLHSDLAQSFGERFWLSDRQIYTTDREVISNVDTLWHDAASKEVFRRTLAYRCTGDLAAIPEPDIRPQYFAITHAEADKPRRYIDCGAFTGDTILSALDAGVHFDAICAFEPNADSFARLANWAGSDPRLATTERHLVPCAVSGDTSQLRFHSGLGEASHADDSAPGSVQAVSLDDALQGFPATDLKMDIEGAEPEALAGARRLISSCRPRLAICSYHAADHLWRIPQMIQEFGLDYALFLRAHAYNTFELVTYAIPQDQLVPLA